MKEQEKPRKTQIEINEDIIGSLSASERYFIVYPGNKQQMNNSKFPLSSTDPFVLVYKDDDTIQMNALIRKYDNYFQSRQKHYKITHFFVLEFGYILQRDLTIGLLKRTLKRQNIDGLELYADKTAVEGGLLEAKIIEKNIENTQIELQVLIKQIEYTTYIKITPYQIPDFQNYLKIKCRDQIKLEFGQSIDPFNIHIEIKYDGKVGKSYDSNNLTSRDKLLIEVKEGLLIKPTEMRNRLIIKGENFHEVNLDYHAVKNKKIGDLFSDLDFSRKWDTYGLMIDDFVLKNYQSIKEVSKVDELFKLKTGQSQHIVGIVLRQADIFQKEQNQIGSKGKFDLEKVFYKDQTNQKYREKCDQMIKKRAEKAPILEFKDFKNVTPIFRYTSEIKVFGSLTQSKTPFSIYRNLNYFLRNQNFAQTTPLDYINHWQYLFNYELQNQLKKLPNITNHILWRGVEYTPDHKQGDKVLYKQFLSTSMKEHTAANFSEGALFKIVSSFSGKLIQDYSYYMTEAEVLFPPYCQFEILLAAEIDNPHKNSLIKKIKYYEMKQIKREPLPKNILNYIIWVDDHTEEGQTIWNSFNNIKNTTVMIQLLSTKELEHWLVHHKELFKHPEVKIAMITDMVREEEGKDNEIAGIQGITLFRKFLPESNIFLFVGRKKEALEKLEKYGGGLKESEKLKISIDRSKLKMFLKNNGEIQ